jgi:S1-C subfamily serine protease
MPHVAARSEHACDPTSTHKEHSMNRTLAIVAAAAIGGGLAGGVVGLALDGHTSSPDTATASAATTRITSSTEASPAELTPEQIYRQDAPAVVVITDAQTETTQATPFSPAQKQKVTALGSGFVIDKQGNIVTNDHVVQGGSNIHVGFSNGASYPATIVGTDPSTDVAVVRVQAPASALHPLQFDADSTVEVGDPIYAIGNPFGLDRTMTAGIVSALGRDIQAPNGLSIPNAIQTDAAINHGNSGGPLLDRFGHVIGINSQIEGGTVNANVGVGFAVPSDTAKSIADQLIANGHVQHAWLGVEVATIDTAVTGEVSGLPSRGVEVAKIVSGGPAAKAGLKAATRQKIVNGVGVLLGGDVIVSVDGKPVGSSAQLAAIVAAHRPGDQVTLKVVRGGKSRSITVTLGNVPAQS